jgi:thiol-disulfide isomerase/thioredoxin
LRYTFPVVAAVLFALGLLPDTGRAADRGSEGSAHKTASTVLPSHTSNAWDLKPIRLKGLDGKELALKDWSGKVLMLNFWASWCAPCQYEIPEFVGYQKEYADQGLQVVGIGLDEQRRLKNVARTLGINYPVMVIEEQAGAALMREWGNANGIVPYTVVIDRAGRIRYIHRGRMDEYAFQHYVKPLLGS